MEPWMIGELIPIVGILSVACIIIARMSFRFEERKHQMMFQNKGAGNDALRAEVETLRQEVARLRDTSTQYDISIQHTLEELHTRVANLESQRREIAADGRSTQSSQPAILGGPSR